MFQGTKGLYACSMETVQQYGSLYTFFDLIPLYTCLFSLVLKHLKGTVM